jgi:hypothetical protein
VSDRPVLRICTRGNRAAERRYLFDVVFAEWLGIDYDLEFDDGPNVRVGLVGDPQGSRITFPDVLFAAREEDWLTLRSLPRRPLSHLVLDPGESSTSARRQGDKLTVRQRFPYRSSTGDSSGRSRMVRHRRRG